MHPRQQLSDYVRSVMILLQQRCKVTLYMQQSINGKTEQIKTIAHVDSLRLRLYRCHIHGSHDVLAGEHSLWRLMESGRKLLASW
jgi:hypothetical protein